MPTAHRLAPWLALGLLVASLLAGRDRLRTSRDGLDGLLYNSDYLSPAALYQDVVLDGYPVTGFHCSAATFAVPDYLVYFLARAVVGSHAVALPVWVAGLFLLQAAAGVWAGCELRPDRRRATVTVGLSGAAGYLGGNAAAGFVHPHNDLLLPVWHTGALTLALAGLAAGLRLARTDRPTRWATVAAGSAAVGLFSDRFIGFYLILPVAAGLMVGWRRGTVPGRRLLLWLGATAGGGLIGLLLLRAFQGPADPLANYWQTPDVDKLAERAGLLAAVVGTELRAGNPLLIGAAGWYLAAVAAGLRRLIRTGNPSAVGLAQVVSGVMLAGVTAAFLLSSAADDFLPTLDWVVFGRYFVGPVGVAWVGWGVGLAGGRRWAVAPLLAGPLVGWAVVAPPVVDRPGIGWYPDQVRLVDEACRSRGLTRGLTGYGDGKPCTLLSRAGVTLRQVRPDAGVPAGLTAFFWLGNRHWYTRRPGGGPADFQFVLVGDRPGRDGALPEKTVVERLGEPAERVSAGERVLLVYDRPGDWRLRRFGECDPWAVNSATDLQRGPAVYPGAALHTPAGAGVTDTPDLVRVATEGRTPTGVMAHGPYRPVDRAGKYRATFRLDAAADAGPVGYVDVLWVGPGAKESGILAAAAVQPGDGQEVTVDFRVGSRRVGGSLEFRTSFAGRGRLTLREVRVERGW